MITEFLVNGGLQLIQKRLIANAILLILNDAIFIKTNMKTKNLQNEKDWRGRTKYAQGG